MARRNSSRSDGAMLIPEVQPLRFDEKLVLNQWILGLFDRKKFDDLAGGNGQCASLGHRHIAR